MSLFTKFSPLVLILCLLTSILHAQNRYWVAATPALWSSDNWSNSSSGAPDGAGPPNNTQIAIFDGGGTGNCTLDAAPTVEALNLFGTYTGTVDLNGNALSVLGSTNNAFAGGTLTDATNTSTLSINSNATTTFSGTTFGAILNVSSNRVFANGSTFSAAVTLTKTGGSNDYSNGNNTFSGTTTITNAGTGFIVMGNNNPDVFNGNLLLNNTGTSRLYLAHNSAGNIINGTLTMNNTSTGNNGNMYLAAGAASTVTVNSPSTFINNGTSNQNRIFVSENGQAIFNSTLMLENIGTGTNSGIYLNNNASSNNQFNDNIMVSSTSGQGVRFGNNTGTATLAATKTVSIAGVGFTAGRLLFRNFTQLGNSLQNLTTTGTSEIYLQSSNWEGIINFSAARIYTLNSIYQSNVTLEKTGTGNDYSVGGNTFNADATFINSGSGLLVMGNTSADIFNSNVNLNNPGTSNIYLSHGGTGHQIVGNLTINQTSSSTNSRTYVANNLGDLTIGGTVNVINNSTGTGNHVFLGVNGSITFNNDLDLQNIGTSANSAIYLNHTSGTNTYNANIVVTSTGGQGVRFGEGNGTGTLSTGNSISIGAGGFSSGTLRFRNFTQVGATAQNLTLTGTGYFISQEANWGGAVNFAAPRIYTRGSTYQGTAYLEKTGTTNDASPGGNTFTNNATFVNTGSAYFLMGNGTADIFNGNVDLDNRGTNRIYLANSGIGHQIAGNLSINQTATGASSFTYVATNTGSALTVNGTTTVINNGTGNDNRIYLGNSGSITFNNTLDLQNIGTGASSAIYVGINATATNIYNENITVSSTSGQGIRFGQNGGAGTLAATKTVTVGAGGFSSGDLRFRNFTQVGPTPHNITLTGTARIYCHDADWGGDIQFIAPRVYTRGTNYQGTLYLEKNGVSDDYSPGGNTIAGNAELRLTGLNNGRLFMGGGTADIFNGDLTMNNTSKNRLYAAHRGTGHLIQGNLTINMTSDSSNSHVYLNNDVGSTLTINGTTTVLNTAAGGSRAYLGFHGSVTFNNTIDLQNNGTSNGNGIYVGVTTNSINTYNENITVSSSIGRGIRFGNNGGTGTLAATKTVTVGPGGFTRGRLYFRNFTQVGNTPQSITLTTSGYFLCRDANWGGNVTFIAPRMNTRGTTYNGITYLEKTRNSNDYSYGGNTFQQETELVNSLNAMFAMGNNVGDIFNADLTIRNRGRNHMSIANNSPGNQFNGKVYYYNLATDNSDNNCFINNGTNATSTFADSIYFINNANGRNRFHISSNGQATFNGPVVMQNFGTNTGNAIFCNTSTTGSTFNNNITVESTIGQGIFFGNNGGATTLNSGYTITLGTTGFALGRLRLRNFTQLGNTPQNITLTATALLDHIDSEWNGVVNFVAPRHFVRGTTFNNDSYLEKNGNGNDYGYGGNTFNAPATLHVTGGGHFCLSNTAGNDFNADVILRQSANGRLFPAYNAASTFAGDISIDYISTQSVLFANAGNGRVIMDGNQAQVLNDIGTSQTPIIRRLEMNKPLNDLTIQIPVIVSNELNLIQGNINTTHTNLLTMQDNAVVPTVSNASYIEGPLEKIGNDNFIFPVGKAGFYREISISAPVNTNARFRAEYFLADPDPLYNRSLKEPTLDSISPCEYWILDRNTTTNSVVVGLSWNAATSCGAGVPTELQVARWDGALWRDHGNGGVSGNRVLTAGAVTDFSPFTLTVDTLLNLPVELLSFEANRLDVGNVQLDWITATELNNVGFEVQRMLDDEFEFTTIDWVDGVGNSIDYVNYKYNDENAYTGISYYRLRQVDFDGTESFSEVRAVRGHDREIEMEIGIYPNPVKDVLNIHFGDIPDATTYSSVKIVSMSGQILHQFESGAQSHQILEIDFVSKLAPGAYLIHIKLNTSEETIFNFVKQ